MSHLGRQDVGIMKVTWDLVSKVGGCLLALASAWVFLLLLLSLG